MYEIGYMYTRTMSNRDISLVSTQYIDCLLIGALQRSMERFSMYGLHCRGTNQSK